MKKICTLLLFSIIFLFISCSGSKQIIQKQKSVFFPKPPLKPRIQFLTSFSQSTDFSDEQSFFMKYIAGNKAPLKITKPYGISTSKNRVFVCDTFLKGLEVIKLDKNTFHYFIPEGRGMLKKPINCFVDEDGILYVVDVDRKQIVIFNKEFEYIGEIGDDIIQKPTDIFIFKNKIYVNDLLGRSIHVFDKKSREFIKTISISTDKKNKLYSPTNIYISGDQIYISDIGDSKIKIFNFEGEFLNSIGSPGSKPGSFSRPKGIAVDKEGLVYAVDSGFENIQIFSSSGELLLFFGGTYKNSNKGQLWLPAKVAIDYKNISYFQKYVDPEYNLKYLIFVTNQYGPDKVNVYGFIDHKKIN